MTSTVERLSVELATRYRVERELGAGGMATVYLAQDLRHSRQVAIKVLDPNLTALIGASRFLAEIRTTAALQHPHILPLFDSGEAGPFLFFVMPYVEGGSLRERLTRERQLSVVDAVRIASDVASALDYAHRQGVVHRDIKPENVLFHDGRALVADFGIALATSEARTGGRMTSTGLSLGTPQYMSPEQAGGEREITARSDIFALGAMLYEMLLGTPPFTGLTSQAIMSKICNADPEPPRNVRKSVPAHVQDALLTALEKLPADRFPTAAAFAEALNEFDPSSGPHGSTRERTRIASRAKGAKAAAASWATRLQLAGFVLAAGVVGWGLRALVKREPAVAPVRMAFELAVPAVDRPHLDISPDGRRIIQVVSDSNGVDRILMRDLGSIDLVTIAGSEGATDPVFSLDGEWISFNSDGKLRKVPVRGGPAVVVADSASVGGGAWTPDGSIIFTRDGRGLWRVPASGGTPVQLTTLDTTRKEFNHWYPQVLPGGGAVIYTAYATPIARASIQAFDLETRKTTVLAEGAVYGRYASNGNLLYARDGAIFAAPFDRKALKLLGTPLPVQDDVSWVATDGLAGFAVAPNGTMAYLRASDWNVASRVVWTDRTGREAPALSGLGAYAEPRLSPDGRWIVVTITEPRRELWLYDVKRGVLTPLSRTENAAFNAIWAPDSKSVVYDHENPVYDLHRLLVDGSGTSTTVVSSRWDKFASSISSDGRLIAYVENNNSDRIYIAHVDGSQAPRPLTPTGTSERSAAFSPNGRWIAYEDLTHGEPNVYLIAVDGSGGRRQVSVEGGEQPRWTREGREIVYRRGSAVMSVVVDPASGDVGKPVLLFRKRQPDRLGGGRTLAYDVSPDGNRFLLVVPEPRVGAQPTMVVLNWFEELKARAVGAGSPLK